MTKQKADHNQHAADHSARSAQSPFHPAVRDIVRVGSRRWFLQTGLAGIGGLSLPAILELQSRTAAASETAVPHDKKAVILFWLSGGPSHLDMWDPKPDAPSEIRGPYSAIPTKVPGVRTQRAFATAGFDRRQAFVFTGRRLQSQQPYANHDAGGQSAGAADR